MKQLKFQFLLCVIGIILQGCGAGQSLTFEPVHNLNHSKYANQKYFYRSSVLEKRDKPTGFFWKLKTKC
jgi:hypothetical protein